MPIVEVDARNAKTPEERAKILDEILGAVGPLPPDMAEDLKAKVIKMLESPQLVVNENLRLIARRLDGFNERADSIQTQLRETAQTYDDPKTVHEFGQWDGMLTMAMGAMHSIAKAIEHFLDCECHATSETERPPAPEAE